LGCCSAAPVAAYGLWCRTSADDRAPGLGSRSAVSRNRPRPTRGVPDTRRCPLCRGFPTRDTASPHSRWRVRVSVGPGPSPRQPGPLRCSVPRGVPYAFTPQCQTFAVHPTVHSGDARRRRPCSTTGYARTSVSSRNRHPDLRLRSRALVPTPVRSNGLTGQIRLAARVLANRALNVRQCGTEITWSADYSRRRRVAFHVSVIERCSEPSGGVAFSAESPDGSRTSPARHLFDEGQSPLVPRFPTCGTASPRSHRRVRVSRGPGAVYRRRGLACVSRTPDRVAG
jgi:hypothetical protein